MKELVRAFLADEAGGPAAEYALIACAFAGIMLGMTSLVSSTAQGQMVYTYQGLNNRNGVTP